MQRLISEKLEVLWAELNETMQATTSNYLRVLTGRKHPKIKSSAYEK